MIKPDYRPPEYCNSGMCNRKTNTALIETMKHSGKKQVTAFSQVSADKSNSDINPNYTFVRWHTWCAECYMEHVDKQQEKLKISSED